MDVKIVAFIFFELRFIYLYKVTYINPFFNKIKLNDRISGGTEF